MTQALYRNNLPQMNGKPFLTDGGLETTLVFLDAFDLPLFAAFTLLKSPDGRAAIDRYMRKYCEIAVRDKKGFILDTPTWRASRRWANELKISTGDLRAAHAQAISALRVLRAEFETPASPFVINGALGPQDDGYNPETFMSPTQARDYHAQQIGWFTELGADMVSAVTLTYVEEAVGVAMAAQAAGIPCVISFTVETDGNLPSGQPLGEAIEQVDRDTGSAPAYFMINCAHPDHFAGALGGNAEWLKRIMGLRANASRMSHEELDNAEELDAGNPNELGGQYRDLKTFLPNLTVMGGCCGTDHRHVDAISAACGR
ncbi:MAG: homocysteine S-methyltransferase [Alphaproteobacteria bacterium]|nr:homocysteine S-methyltransferase [Alphaproteobacteria bacterium]